MENKERILNNILYSSMVFSLAYIFAIAIGLDIGFILQAFIVFLFSMIIKFLIFNPIFVYVFLIIIFISTIVISYFFPFFIAPFIESTTMFITNVFHNLRGRENIASENILIFWGVLVIFISLCTGIIIFKKKSIYLLLPIYTSFFLFYWYTHIDPAYWMFLLFLAMFFILMALNKYNSEVFIRDKFFIPDYKDLYPPWIKIGILYALIIIILAATLPKTSNIIKWPWLQAKVYQAFPEIENWRSSGGFSKNYGTTSYFDFSLTGYEAIPSRLGGPVELSDEKIMTVYSDNPQYLRGNIKHKYTGDYWEILASNLEDYRSGNDFSKLKKFEKNKFYKESSIKITFNSFSSKTIFAPYRPSNLHLEKNSKIMVDMDYGLILSDGIYSGEGYNITAQLPLPYDELIKLGISNKKEDIINLNKYLDIPEDKISDATKDLTKNIVKGLDSDIEKARAMEDYLRNNYEYSLDVSQIPENHEFIDYFLFVEGKGYCTYYATTLAIMLRLENIPSRYIEGYLARDLKTKGVYQVKQENAHTWVEAFIEPVGWIRLEPTPAYPISPRYDEVSGGDASYDETGEPNTILPDRDFWEEGKKPEAEDQEDMLNGNNIVSEENQLDERDNRKRYFLLFLGGLFSILPIRFLFVFFKIKYKNFKMKNYSDRKKIVYLYNDIVKLAEVLGYPQEYGETHSEYASRIAFNFYYFDHKGKKEITENFIRNKYGNSPVPEEDILEMENFKKNLKQRIRSNLGVLKYLQFYLKL